VDANRRLVREDVEVVRNAYAAFGRRDMPALLDILHPDIEWAEPTGAGPLAGRFRGHEEVMAGVLTGLPDDTREFNVEPEEFLDASPHIAVLGHHRGLSPITGEPFEVPFAHVWTLKAGVAVRFRSYLDTVELGRVLFASADPT